MTTACETGVFIAVAAAVVFSGSVAAMLPGTEQQRPPMPTQTTTSEDPRITQFRTRANAASGNRQKEMIEARDVVAKALTPAQLADAQKRAREWTEAFDKRIK